MKLPKISRQKAIAMSLGFVLSLIYLYTGFFNIVIAFLLVGAIPGTSLSLSPLVMLALYGAIAWLLVFRSSVRYLTDSVIKNRHVIKQLAHKQRLPKRRLGRI